MPRSCVVSPIISASAASRPSSSQMSRSIHGSGFGMPSSAQRVVRKRPVQPIWSSARFSPTRDLPVATASQAPASASSSSRAGTPWKASRAASSFR
ncbi:MAG: hypothetical protein ABS55_11790 [Lautropia sp. SCN 70-15]|nr:MAG: hypothetical protein ABS55_11790 [Lautropia sp. SCN 70-15]